MQMAPWRRRDSARMAQARCAQELSNVKKRVAGTRGTDWHAYALLLVRLASGALDREKPPCIRAVFRPG